MLKAIRSGKYNFLPEGTCPKAKDLISKMIVVDVDNRYDLN